MANQSKHNAIIENTHSATNNRFLIAMLFAKKMLLLTARQVAVRIVCNFTKNNTVILLYINTMCFYLSILKNSNSII